MNGAEILLKTAARAGVTVCFSNPGTTEMPIVAAFDAVTDIRPVLGLFEGCCSGAADGYGRMTGTPAMTLFHLGPGFGNGLANLHNARRAGTPVFNVIGDHASWHRGADAPLTMDIESLAHTVSGWVRTAASPDSLSQDTADALAAAGKGMGATLILPQDVQWSTVAAPQIVPAEADPEAPDADAVQKAALLLKKKGNKSAIILGGSGLHATGLRQASRIASASGCSLLSETFPARMERGRGLPAVARLPYAPAYAFDRLAAFDTIILAGTREPVAFFGYRNGRSRLTTEAQRVIRIAKRPDNAGRALQLLAEALEAPPFRYQPAENAGTGPKSAPAFPQGKLNAKKVSIVLASMQPENAIIVDESITSAAGYYKYTAASPPFSLLTLTGGAIGMGLPCSIGAALACPDRPVIVFQADGSAMYTLQALWTQARESLNVTTLICANQAYNILKTEFKRAENRMAGSHSARLMELGRPNLDWVSMSCGMGVPARAVDTVEELVTALERAFTEPGPNLIQVNLITPAIK
ncbi:MAG: acetolactate synthase large subunit [Deltaproteobacteria bacterium]|nr:acetolactate synthase large subunit [Deltaproteobacteria bacterium]